MAYLRQAIESDKGFNPEGASGAFASLQSDPLYQSFIRRAARKFPAVHSATLACTLGEKDLIPEGLAFGPSTHVFYLGSLNRRKIVQFKHGDSIDFVPADRDQLLPVLGMKVDPADGGLWVNTGSDSSGESELVHFSRQGQLLGRWKPDPGKHLLNDLVLRGANEIFVTDSLANQVYRFDGQAGTFTGLPLARPLYYPNGIAISPGGDRLYVADAFGILCVHLADQSSVELSPPAGATLAGVDGMYWDRGALLAVQNGIGLPRIARFSLSKDGLRVLKTTVLEYRSAFMELPTTGAIVGRKFYFISNSQVDNLHNGKIVDPAKLRPVRIGVVALR
jgi:sugar lactone lactonase YvrE